MAVSGLSVSPNIWSLGDWNWPTADHHPRLPISLPAITEGLGTQP